MLPGTCCRCSLGQCLCDAAFVGEVDLRQAQPLGLLLSDQLDRGCEADDALGALLVGDACAASARQLGIWSIGFLNVLQGGVLGYLR